MAHLPLRREASGSSHSTLPHRRNDGLEVLEQMYGYFSYDDIEAVQHDDGADYELAA